MCVPGARRAQFWPLARKCPPSLVVERPASERASERVHLRAALTEKNLATRKVTRSAPRLGRFLSPLRGDHDERRASKWLHLVSNAPIIIHHARRTWPVAGRALIRRPSGTAAPEVGRACGAPRSSGRFRQAWAATTTRVARVVRLWAARAWPPWARRWQRLHLACLARAPSARLRRPIGVLKIDSAHSARGQSGRGPQTTRRATCRSSAFVRSFAG